MGRRAHSRPLSIWTNGELVGHWTPAGSQPMRLAYADSWLKSSVARPLSLSLPLPLLDNTPLRGELVENFFENLLPESSAIRKRLAQRYAAGSEGTFDLLAAIGRDCVGAVQLLDAQEEPKGFDRIDGEPLDDEAVAAVLRSAVTGAQFGKPEHEQDFRISIAGVQEKTALLRHQGQWMRPLGATPTTHIIKLPLGLVGNMQADMRTSVYNEWLCLKLMGALGFDVAQADIVTFADHAPVLVVERFDRKLHPSKEWILRLPQEDFCQAYGVNPANKYEADGGPGIEKLAQVLHGSQNARADLRMLLASQITFWLMAATDGHAKNFSIRLHAGGAYALTPWYDVLSAWPIIGKGKTQLAWKNAKLAMAVSGKNRHYHLATVMRRHFNATAAKCGWGENAEDIIGELLFKVDGAIEAVAKQLPPGFPEGVATAIFKGMRTQATRLQEQPAN
ncbi:type II toxin-antitoxin system HipA family toxin [Ottowia thiooxydans]|uniref:Serine/threonine-protein kinase HipA n=1 Tax=Ottowia thiooxydans TaxID=219182 RepID=A0ABV2Q8Q1_9BURK